MFIFTYKVCGDNDYFEVEITENWTFFLCNVDNALLKYCCYVSRVREMYILFCQNTIQLCRNDKVLIVATSYIGHVYIVCLGAHCQV